MYNKLKITLILTILLSQFIQGQTSTNSPYSLYGYGLMEQTAFGRNQGMGNVGIAIRSNVNLSPLNPASYSAIDTMSQLLEFGVTGYVEKFKDQNASSTSPNANMSYVAIAFPLNRNSGMSIGLAPVSRVGYEFTSTVTDPEELSYIYNGSGGLSKFYMGGAYEINNRLSLGLNAAYIFGKVAHYQIGLFADNTNNKSFSKENSFDVGTVQFTYGLQYRHPMANRANLIIGATYEPQTSLKATGNEIVTNTSTGATLLDNSDVPIGLDLPSTVGLGLSYGINNKFTIGADFVAKAWSNTSFETLSDTASLRDTKRIAIGGEYIPDVNSKSYFKRTKYRFGASTENNYLSLYDEDVIDFGITFGLGLPLSYASKTSVNVAFEYGKQGTTDNNLVRQDFYKVTVNLSLSDMWFFKRKFE